MPDDETRYRILRLLEDTPALSQRDLAAELGVSVGKANYCLHALMDKGLVKASQFRRDGNKLAYVYELTPSGVAEKIQVTRRFLQHQIAEYEALRIEIEQLRREDDALPPDTLR